MEGSKDTVSDNSKEKESMIFRGQKPERRKDFIWCRKIKVWTWTWKYLILIRSTPFYFPNSVCEIYLERWELFSGVRQDLVRGKEVRWFHLATDSEQRASMWLRCEEFACNGKDPSSIPGSGGFLEEDSSPVQYSCLESSWTEEPCRVTVHGSQRLAMIEGLSFTSESRKGA